MELKPFELEDFFCEYEHRKDLVNLASSDALPWNLDQLRTQSTEVKAWFETAEFGYPDVEHTVVPKLRSFYGNPNEVVFLATSGAAEAIYLVLNAILIEMSKSPTIGIFEPGYGAFDGISRLLGYTTRYYSYHQADNWQVRDEEVRALAKDCDVLIVNNPHNPTGRTWNKRLLADISTELKKRNGFLVCDEVFLLKEDECTTCLGINSNVLVVGSLSKVYGFPGLRLGWAAGPPGLLRRMKTLQQYFTLSINSFAAKIGEIVLSKPSAFSRYELLVRNRQHVLDWSNSYGDILKITPAEAGTTVLLEALRPVHDAGELFENLLNEGVLLAPGIRCFASKSPQWFRLGYGTNERSLLIGLDKVAKVLSRL